MEREEEEGGPSGNHHKTQVILHLQPILPGINEDTADTGTTILAIETHHDHSEVDGEGMEYGYPITCGESRAVLLFKKFVCPGINVRCVKFNDQLISPKQFVHLAGKATLKDWKRAIRLGGVMLRKMMDSGQIDFYQHDTACSNTCRSTKFDMLINSTPLPPGTSVQPSPSCLALDPLGGQVAPLTGELLQDAAETEDSLGDKFSATAEWSPGPAGPVKPTAANGHAAKRRTDTPDGVFSLWKGVADCGLMGEVLYSLQTELLGALRGAEVRSQKASLQESDAIILNSLCEMFGLLDSVKQALEQRRRQIDDNKVHDYELEEILEERRKQSCHSLSSLKRSRTPRCNLSNTQTRSLPSPSPSKAVIQPVSVTALSAASYAQLAAHVQHVSLPPAPGRQLHCAGTGRTDRDNTGASPGGKREPCEIRRQERSHRLGQETLRKEEASGIQRAPGLREGKFRQDQEFASEAEGLDEVEKLVLGRKASKKLKTK